MTAEDRGVVLAPSQRRTTAYIIKYVGFIIYGFHASAVGIPTIGSTTSADWAFIWPLIVSVLAMFAITGVVRTRRTNRVGLEVTATVFLLAHLTTYSAYIVIRAYGEEDGFLDAAAAWLPILLCVFPFARLVTLSKYVNLPRWVYRIFGRGQEPRR